MLTSLWIIGEVGEINVGEEVATHIKMPVLVGEEDSRDIIMISVAGEDGAVVVSVGKTTISLSEIGTLRSLSSQSGRCWKKSILPGS